MTTPPIERLAADNWRRTGDTVELLAAACRACGTPHLPQPTVCTRCHAADFERVALVPTGTLYAYTVIHSAPPGYEEPYAVAYVDFPEGVRVFGHLRLPADGSRPAPDTPVTVEAAVLLRRPDGTAAEGYRFVPRTITGERA